MNFSNVRQRDLTDDGDESYDEITEMANANFDMTKATARYLKTLYVFIDDNRDEFGYPEGCETIPYLYVSDDLFGKFIHLIKLCMDHEVGIDDENMESLLQNLLDSYDENDGDTGFTHSQPASTVESLLTGFRARQREH
jgi:hypothetical protein